MIQPLQLTDAEIAFYQDEGYLVLPGLIRADAVAALSEEVFAILAANGVPRESLFRATGAADKLRQCAKYLPGSLLDQLINGPATCAIASQLLGGAAHVYLPFTAVKAACGGGPFHFHQDNNYTRHEPATGSLNIWVALVDMTPANGCLQTFRVPTGRDNSRRATATTATATNKSKWTRANACRSGCARVMPWRSRAGPSTAPARTPPTNRGSPTRSNSTAPT